MSGGRAPLFRLRSLRNKLALVFFAIIGSALAVIYFSVVTYPQSNLEERRLRDLELVAGIYQSQLETLPLREERKGQIARTVRSVAENTESNVTLFYWDESPVGPQGDLRGLQFYARFDSREQTFFPETTPCCAARFAAGVTRPASAPSRGRT